MTDITMPAVTQIITPQSRRFLARQPAEERPISAAAKVITFFKEIQAGTGARPGEEEVAFQLAKEDYAQIEHTLKQDKSLAGFVQAKIRYEYDADSHKLTVRMPSSIHEYCTREIERYIEKQLEVIRSGSGKKAKFAQDVFASGSPNIAFEGSRFKYSPDVSFKHARADYPGVIIEVAFSQTRRSLRRLAENYLLDSKANIRVVVGIDIAYGGNSRKVTLSVWRGKFFDTTAGRELRAVPVVEDKAFRDEGNPVENQGLQLHLSDFTYEDLAREVLDTEDAVISVSSEQLYKCIQDAEKDAQPGKGTAVWHDNMRVRRRTPTPPEGMQSSDEAEYARKERAIEAKLEDEDPDYQDS